MIEIVYSSHPNGNERGVLLMGYLYSDLVGTAVASILGTMMELESIHTNPNARRNGVASALLQEVREWGKSKGGVYLTGELRVRKDTITEDEVVAWYKKRNIGVKRGKLYGRL